MLTSFTAEGHTIEVYINEDEAYANQSTTNFVMSLENITDGLYCDNYTNCDQCPFDIECGLDVYRLPLHLVTEYAPHIIQSYPEYFI